MADSTPICDDSTTLAIRSSASLKRLVGIPLSVDDTDTGNNSTDTAPSLEDEGGFNDDAEQALLDDEQRPGNGGQRNDGDSEPLTGSFRTFVNFLKANLGTGILTIPDAIKNAGLFFGSISLTLIGLLATYCCHQLLRAYRQVSADRPLSYAQVVDLVFRRSTGRVRRLAKLGRFTIDAVLVSTQVGYCSVYILFCSRMIKEVVDSYQPESLPDRHGIRFYESILAAFLVPYCFITTLKALSIFSTIANIASIVCIVTVLQYVFRNLQSLSAVDWFPTNVETLPLFFGTTMFTFESIALILPIENRMKDRRVFHGWNGMLTFCMLLIIASYVTMGFFGYLAFGKETKMILSNMPADVWIYQAVKLVYALCIVITFNLQIYVPVQILIPGLKRGINQPWFNRFGEYILRLILVLTTYFLALNIPCLEYMVSLFGAFASSWLSLILPPVIEVVSCTHPGQQHRLTFWLFVKNGAIFAFGIFGCVVGTTTALISISKALSQPGGCSTA